jgi:hypothetical protein
VAGEVEAVVAQGGFFGVAEEALLAVVDQHRAVAEGLD